MNSQEQIDDALRSLRVLIEQAVRDEQLRDQLTGLPNDAALTALLESSIQNSRPFWLAFIEIDYFKRVNNLFGYENADALLKAVAGKLSASTDIFAPPARAFHAHGDEFYLFGELSDVHSDPATPLADALDHVRESVRRIRLLAGTSKQEMTCTVSIGWLTSTHAILQGEGAHIVRQYIELALATAKQRGRDRVVEYDSTLTKLAFVSDRATCTECGTIYAYDVPRASYKSSALQCPNCGSASERPPLPAEIAPPPSQSI